MITEKTYLSDETRKKDVKLIRQDKQENTTTKRNNWRYGQADYYDFLGKHAPFAVCAHD